MVFYQIVQAILDALEQPYYQLQGSQAETEMQTPRSIWQGLQCATALRRLLHPSRLLPPQTQVQHACLHIFSLRETTQQTHHSIPHLRSDALCYVTLHTLQAAEAQHIHNQTCTESWLHCADCSSNCYCRCMMSRHGSSWPPPLIWLLHQPSSLLMLQPASLIWMTGSKRCRGMSCSCCSCISTKLCLSQVSLPHPSSC